MTGVEFRSVGRSDLEFKPLASDHMKTGPESGREILTTTAKLLLQDGIILFNEVQSALVNAFRFGLFLFFHVILWIFATWWPQLTKTNIFWR